MDDENFATSARFLVFLGMVFFALFFVDDHKMEVFVFACAVAVYLESRKEGWQSPLIEWPEELSFLSTCYYASLKLLKIGTVIETVVLIYLFWNGVMNRPDLFQIAGNVYLANVIWLSATASTLSICWSIHDKWAERTGSTTITSLKPPFTQGNRGFKKWSWLLMDGIMIMALVIMWWDHFELHLYNVFEGTVICSTYFILMLPLQLWLYFHYMGMLPQVTADAEN